MSEWRDISTAPKDGTKILACISFISGRKVVEVIYARDVDDALWFADVRDADDALWFADDCELSNACDPTHWMPLPDPPK